MLPALLIMLSRLSPANSPGWPAAGYLPSLNLASTSGQCTLSYPPRSRADGVKRGKMAAVGTPAAEAPCPLSITTPPQSRASHTHTQTSMLSHTHALAHTVTRTAPDSHTDTLTHSRLHTVSPLCTKEFCPKSVFLSPVCS